MEAGQLNYIWTVEELVAIMPEPVTKKRSSYKKAGTAMVSPRLEFGFIYTTTVKFRSVFERSEFPPVQSSAKSASSMKL